MVPIAIPVQAMVATLPAASRQQITYHVAGSASSIRHSMSSSVEAQGFNAAVQW